MLIGPKQAGERKELEECNLTGYESIKKQRTDKLQKSQQELLDLKVRHIDSPDELVDSVYKSGLRYAIEQIDGWERLNTKAHEMCNYTDPKEAAREHGNIMRLLAVIKNGLQNRYEGKP
jgi:hypothetical protein